MTLREEKSLKKDKELVKEINEKNFQEKFVST
mgnify:CR=1 FL=1